VDNKDFTKIQDVFYEEVYPHLVSRGNQGRYHALTHRLLERGFSKEFHVSKVLEVGAGSGEHLEFVNHSFDQYFLTDLRIVEKLASQSEKVIAANADVSHLPFIDDEFDRVISTCLLHHVEDPLRALQEIARVTKPGGFVSIMIANDPGIFYRMARRFTSRRQIIKLGFLEADLLHSLEHRNHFWSIDKMIEAVFREHEVSSKMWPFKFLNSWNLNLLTVYQIKISS
jgi:phosphatidylethanolamine/phosphatidyl-N-methylethanolamine N-methyltransferase